LEKLVEKQQSKKNKNVKRENTLLVVIISLFIGFVGGAAFTVYNTDNDGSHKVQTNQEAKQKQHSNPTASDKMSEEIGALEKKVAQNPKDAQTWVQLGNYYFDTNKFEKAIEAYNRYLEFDPDNASVITDLGVMYRRSGKPVEAIETFNLAIEKDPKHEIARFNKGVVLMHDLKDTNAAIKAWEELIEINPLAVTPGGQPVDEILQSLKENI